MTPDTIEQQARREAEEPTLTVAEAIRAITPFTSKDIEEHYRARLTAAAKLRSKPQPTVEAIMAIVGPLCLGEATELHITDRLTTLLNTSAAMAEVERCQQRVKDSGVGLGELDRITDQGREG